MSQKIVKSKQFISSSDSSSDEDSQVSQPDVKNLSITEGEKDKSEKGNQKLKKKDKEIKLKNKNLLTSDESEDEPIKKNKKKKIKKKVESESESDTTSKVKITKPKPDKKDSNKTSKLKPEKKSRKRDKSSSDEEEKPKKKKTILTKDSYMKQLGTKGKKYIRSNVFKNTSYIDIREMYEKDGKMNPGAKGISLKESDIKLFYKKETLDQIKQNIDGLKMGASEVPKIKLTEKIQISVRKFKSMTLVDIREYYKAGDELKPGKKGISLTIEQYRCLKDEKEQALAMF